MAANFHQRFSQFCLPACCLLAACGGGGDVETPNTQTSKAAIAPRPLPQSDIQIAQAVYSDSQRTPVGFYSDTGPAGTIVATTHIKSADIGNAAPLYELCSDDWTQAYNWSEQVAQANSQYGSLQVSDSTDRFFEFTRVRNTQPTGIWRARIFRCTYLDRSSVDLRTAYSHAGQLNRRPVTAETLRELTEYFWLFSTYNNYGNVVLQSMPGVTANGLQHTLFMASLAPNAGANSCDRITVKAWSYLVDAQSGELTLANTTLWSFDAKRVAGLAEVCATIPTQ